MIPSRRRFIKIGGLTTLASLSGIGLAFSSCANDDDSFDPNNNLNIKKVIIPSSLDILAGGEVTLSGQGFLSDDRISLTSTMAEGTEFSSEVSSVTENSVSFPVPEGFSSGIYRITLIRGEESLVLGSLLINLVVDTDIPDIEGMTVKGLVYSDGIGIPGVVVSDGYEVTVTDEQGRYYLPSLKKTGYVFISVPGNYEVVTNGNAPQFFKRLTGSPQAVEQRDFSLISVNNENHVVIPMADWHLADRNNDLDQFNSKVLPDVNATIDQYASGGNKVYVLTLGDMTWDSYWYSNNFGLNEYIPYMNKLNSPVFNIIGNHDNDPYVADDWDSEDKYRAVIGPTYYSFNLGRVHYVVLDNVEYLNSGGSEGNVGQRNYNDVVVADQMEWLKKDLATITDKSTPVVIAMHTPLYNNPSLDGSGNQVNSINLLNGSALIDSLKDFSTVHVLSGHTHINYKVEEESNLMEHNTAAICATWWWTGRNGYAGNHICKDGSPGGYGIWKINGTDMQWSYKSIGYDEDYQFRTYDLNEIHITADKFAPDADNSDLAPYAGPYVTPSSANEVLINVWGYDSQWKVEVTENGNPLEVTRVSTKDPLHIVSYEAFRVNAGAVPTSAFVTNNTSHFFKVKAGAANSTLEIKVTDRFGKVYTQSMERPKAFSLDMS